MNTSRLLLPLVTVTALLLTGASQAKAITAYLPSGGGTAVLAQVNGVAAVVHMTPGGTCSQIDLGVGGLSGTTAIWGSESVDFVLNIVSGSLAWCNRTLYPVVTNSYYIIVYGNGGDDNLSMHGISTVSLQAGAGNDYLSLANSNYSASGSSGNDWLDGFNGSTLYAGPGDDKLCIAAGQQASYADGGNGYDTICGSVASTPNPPTIEGVVCPC